MGLIFISASSAWTLVVTSVCAILMLGVLAALYASGHETFVGSINGPSPEAAPGLVRNMVIAMIVYAGLLVFCLSQIALHKRARGRGEIAL